jgi:hypothetical protein
VCRLSYGIGYARLESPIVYLETRSLKLFRE